MKAEQKLKELLRQAYQWGRDNGSNRNEKNFNDFLQTPMIINEIIESYANEVAIGFELFMMKKDTDIDFNRRSVEHAYDKWKSNQEDKQ